MLHVFHTPSFRLSYIRGCCSPCKKYARLSEANRCSPAGGIGTKVKWLISWPLLLLLFFTVPNCAKPRWEKFFMLSFLLSTVWIAVFSYLMVWMVSMKCIRQGFIASFLILQNPQTMNTSSCDSIYCLFEVCKQKVYSDLQEINV